MADCRLRFGVVERRDLLELVGATELTDEQTQLLKDGMQLLVGYLGAVRAGWDDEDAPIQPREGQWGAAVKDQLEASVCRQLCRGDITLREAQEIFLEPDWTKAYMRYFRAR